MNKMIERIRAAKTWQERAAIAKKKHPVTRFNSFFERADRAMCFAEKGHTGNAQHEAMILGAAIAETISKRDAQTLTDMAKALAQWKHHECMAKIDMAKAPPHLKDHVRKAKPDYVLMVLASMAGMFPPGWTKKWKLGGKVRSGTRDALATRDIMANLKRLDPEFFNTELATYRKRIRRYAKKLRIPLDGSLLKSKTKVGHNRHKKVG